MASRRGESVLLVVFLVFFILLSIGLGGWVWYIYQDEEDLNSQRTQAETAKKAADDERNWYKFQALYLRDLDGKLQPKDREELVKLRAEYDGKKLGTQAKDKDEVQTVIKDLDNSPGWNDADKKAKTDYPRMLAAQKDELDQAKKAANDARDAVADYTKKLNDKEEELKSARTKYNEKLAELQKVNDTNFKAYQDKIAQIVKDFKATGELNAKLTQEVQTVRESQQTELAKLQKELRDEKEKEARMQLDLDRLSTPIAQQIVQNDQPKARVVRVDPSGRIYIDVGSADFVKPQLTFSIVGRDADGRPKKRRKGSLEVATVQGEHLSQCRVTEIADAGGDPVLEKDFLYNPLWSPSLRQHVFIAGIVDLAGEGRDGTPEFVRNLQKQGIVVDGYIDVKNRKVVGQVFTQTDFLVLGDRPDFGQGTPNEADPKVQGKNALVELMDKMQHEAALKGIPIVNLRRFLVLSGYRVPRTAAVEAEANYDIHGTRTSVGSPLERKETPAGQPPAMENKGK